jgi:hypothetical protein
MDSRLACQTDVTPDARELYRLRGEDGACDDCRLATALRGAIVPLGLNGLDPEENDVTWTSGGAIVSLARAVLALGQRGPARAVAPGDAAGGASGNGNSGSGHAGQG